MYDELVKRLKYCRNNAAVITDDELVTIADEAADAIEELLAERDEVNADSWKTAFEIERDEHRWIPVAERLPYPGEKVIVAIRDESGDTRFDFTNTGWWSGYGYKFVVEDEFCSWVTHWMLLPEPPEEET